MTESSHQWPQFVAVVTSCLLAVSCGLHFGWPSPAIPKLQRKELQVELSKEEISHVVVIGPMGYLISCPFSAFVVDRIGRKPSLLLLTLPQVFAWILIANGNNLYTLIFARLLAGAAEGATFNILPMYICEISEPKVRGTLGTIFTIALSTGILLINCYGSFTSLQLSAYISISVPLLFTFTFIWQPESPYFFLMKGRIEDARKSLQKLRKMQSVDEELAELTSVVQKQASEPSRMKEVFFVTANLKAFLVLLVLRTLQQFSGYSAFTFYTQVIFEHAGGNLSAAEYAIIYNSSHLIFVSLGSVLLDRFGRRPLLIWSTLSISLVLLIQGLYFYFQHYDYNMELFLWLPITALILYTVMFDIGLGVVPNVLTGEIFSTNVKAKALAILMLYCAFAISASSKLFQWLKHSFGMHVPFFVFSSCCLIGALFCYYYVPETKGKSLEEIQELLKK